MKTHLILILAFALPLNHAQAAGKKTPTPEPPPVADTTPATGSSIKGACTIELKIGTRQYLSKMGIALLPAKTGNEITKVRDNQWRLRASRTNWADGFHNLDLDTIGATAVQNAIQTVQTNMEGQYQIRGIAPGDYLLYSQYHSRYAIAYWLIPLTVKSDKDEITIDINNNNMKEVYNIKKEQW